MLIYFGADHRGFNLKEELKKNVTDMGYEIFDVGNSMYEENDDYPDFALEAAKKISLDPSGSRGILICGSGIGMQITANKLPSIRAGLGLSSDHVFDSRSHDDINILCIASDFTIQVDAEAMVKVFLETPFDRSEKRVRRLNKIAEIETRVQSSDGNSGEE